MTVMITMWPDVNKLTTSTTVKQCGTSELRYSPVVMPQPRPHGVVVESLSFCHDCGIPRPNICVTLDICAHQCEGLTFPCAHMNNSSDITSCAMLICISQAASMQWIPIQMV